MLQSDRFRLEENQNHPPTTHTFSVLESMLGNWSIQDGAGGSREVVLQVGYFLLDGAVEPCA